MLDAKESLDVFPALDNPTRFNILIYLSNEGRQPFSAVQTKFNLQNSTTQHHLEKLMGASLIVNSYQTPTETNGTYSYYELTPRGKEVLQTLMPDNTP